MSFDAAAAARHLAGLRAGKQINAFRQQLTKEQAREVITHPSLDPGERAALLLALAFRGEERRGRWSSLDEIDSEVVQLPEQSQAHPETRDQRAP